MIEAVMVEVKQVDRDAAADFAPNVYDDLWQDEIADLIRQGKRDHTDIVQAFARHRQQAEDAMRERAAAIAMNAWHPSYVEGDLSDPSNWKPGSPYDRGQVDACERIATAIRATQARPAEQRG